MIALVIRSQQQFVLKRPFNLMFPFGLPEFLFTLLVCFNAEAPCNDGIVVAQKPKCKKPTVFPSHMPPGTSFTDIVFPDPS